MTVFSGLDLARRLAMYRLHKRGIGSRFYERIPPQPVYTHKNSNGISDNTKTAPIS